VKYAIVILEGLSDEPLEELDGRTPLEASQCPAMASLAASGRVGRVFTLEEGAPLVREAALASLLGYEWAETGLSRASLVCQASGQPLGEGEWAVSLECVGLRTDAGEPSWSASAGVTPQSGADVTREELRRVLTDVEEACRGLDAELMRGVSFHAHGLSCVMIDRSGRSYEGVEALTPAMASGRAWRQALPGRGPVGSAVVLQRIAECSARVLDGHPINEARAEHGLPPIGMLWPWGPGRGGRPAGFAARTGLRAVWVGHDELALEVARALSIDVRVSAEQELGVAATEELGRADVVVVHSTMADLATRSGDEQAKVAAIEMIDAMVVAPVASRLADFGDASVDSGARGWRLLIVPPMASSSVLRGDDEGWSPFLLAGSWVRSMVARPFAESSASESDLRVDRGRDLLEYVLYGGVPVGRRPVRKSAGVKPKEGRGGGPQAGLFGEP
jgi:2,3-bisphosphoglycerate-independent phosphoglycerate mutase